MRKIPLTLTALLPVPAPAAAGVLALGASPAEAAPVQAREGDPSIQVLTW